MNMSKIFEMVVVGKTNLGYMTGKCVSSIKSNTYFISRENRISKKLDGKFLHKGLSGMSITNDSEFCFHLIKFQSDTIHPFLNANKTLSELSNTRI